MFKFFESEINNFDSKKNLEIFTFRRQFSSGIFFGDLSAIQYVFVRIRDVFDGEYMAAIGYPILKS